MRNGRSWWYRSLVAWALLGAPLSGVTAHVEAQPTAWSAQRVYIPPAGPNRFFLRVLDLGVGGTIATFEAPAGVTMTTGALTPDGRYYLAATNLGVVRFTTSPPAIDRLIAAPGPVANVVVAPTGTTAQVGGGFGRGVIDWEAGTLISSRCCEQPIISFTPDGTRRLEVLLSGANLPSDATVTAIDTATEATLWTRSVPSFGGGLAPSGSHLAFNSAGDMVVLDTTTGTEVVRLPHGLLGMHWRGDSIVGLRLIPSTTGGLGTARLATYRIPAATETVIRESQYSFSSLPIGLRLSADGRHAYLLHFQSLLGISVSNTSYEVIDLDTARTIGRGGFGSQSQADLVLEGVPQCVLAVPEGLTAPARGGTVDVPVVPTANCRPFMAPFAMNPGPHTGPVVVGIHLQPSQAPMPTNNFATIGNAEVRILQDAAPPAAPRLRGTVDGNRARLSWDPGIGAGITGFEIRGAVAGTAMTTVLVTQGSARDWTTPPLAPGSYAVQVAARNFAGPGPASNEYRFSVGVATLPDAPTNLQAGVIGDQVTLSWAPPSSGPAPAAYVVEAAPAGGGPFAAVARTSDTSFRVSGAPVGNWQVRVRGVTAGGAGGPSDVVAVAPTHCASPPSAPQTPWVLVTYPTQTLQWLPPASGSVERYVVEVGTALGRRDIGTLGVNGDTTSVTVPAGSGTPFALARIRAVNACGESAPSPDVSVQLP
jgi:hypothetical protein